MFDSAIIEVIIGVALTYLLISLLCSTLLELVAGLLKLRAKDLEEGVRSLLGPGSADDADATVFNAFFSHPLIGGLMRRGKQPDWQTKRLLGKMTGKRKPSYIPSKTFAAALFDIIAPEDPEAGSRTLAALQDKVSTLPPGTIKSQFRALLTPTTIESMRAYVQEMADSDLKTKLLAILDSGSEIQETIDSMTMVVETEAGALLKAELGALLQPASIETFRTWVAGLPNTAMRGQLTALLGSAAASTFRDKIEAIANTDLKRSLQVLLRETGDDLTKARAEVENWFDQAMDRASGWYKRRAQFLLIIISIPVIAGLNADTISMSTSLWQDDTVRDIAVERAAALSQPSTSPGGTTLPGTQPGAPQLSADDLRDNLSGLTTFGWRKSSPDYKDPREVPEGIDWLWKLFGLSITVGAVSLGADFWFSLMKNLVNIRAAGKPKAAEPTPAPVGGGVQAGPAT